MKLKKRAGPTLLIASVAVVGALVASAAPLQQESTRSAEGRVCCVSNPRFAGTCAVDLGEDESCGDVLAYLNNASSVGKTYCGNTTVRMGWKQTACEE